MVFSSFEFLFVFLPVTFLLYFAVKKKAKNIVLLAASLFFYLWGGGPYIAVILLSITINYFLGLLLAAKPESIRWKRLCILCSVGFNLSALGYFKYANFFIDQVNAVCGTFGLSPIPGLALILPIGISFYTFQSMSYIFDIARGVSKPLKNPIDFATYIAMFPQLIAGPIVRYHVIADQIRNRKSSLDGFSKGAIRFSHGLIKKVVIADAVGSIAEASFALPVSDITTATAWLGAFAYTLQIYFDFSAYSDMAIGLGHIFGFTLPENFNRPYSAVSITDYWRRWHMTLSSWVRDYVYIPMGGSRVKPARMYFNLVLIFLAVGFWHGANYTYVIWGGYHGVLLLFERISGQRYAATKSWVGLRRAITFSLVMLGFVLFRSDNIPHALNYYEAMFSFAGSDLAVSVALTLTNKNLIIFCLSALVIMLPRSFNAGVLLEKSPNRFATAGRIAVMFVGVPYAIMQVASSKFSPFLYFQF